MRLIMQTGSVMRTFGDFYRQTEQVVEQRVVSRVAGDLRRNAINLSSV